MAVQQQVFVGELYLWTLLTAFLLQILSNLANDYGDFTNGIDKEIRTDRALASGNMKIGEMRAYLWLTIALCLASGIGLLIRASSLSDIEFWPMFVMGCASILAALFYTIGKKPYGYLALGDLSVLIFFGIVAVGGTYYVQSGEISFGIIYPAIGAGLLSTGVLNVNNIRDIDHDLESNKRTLANILGLKNALRYHYILLIGAISAIALFNFRFSPLSGFSALLFCLPVIWHLNQMSRIESGNRNAYNQQLKLLSLSSLGLSIITFITAWF